MPLVGTGVQILHEQRLAGGGLDEVLEERVEVLRRHRLGVVPPDIAIGEGVADNELVLDGAPREYARFGDQGTVDAQPRFAALECFLHQQMGVQIAGNARGLCQEIGTQCFMIKTGHRLLLGIKYLRPSVGVPKF